MIVPPAGATPAGRGTGDPIRQPERPADAALLFDLFRSVHGGPLAGLEPALVEALLRQQSAGQALSYRAAFPMVRFDVVEVERRPVGRVVTDATSDHFRLVDVVLLPEWRGLGLGTRLVRGFQAEARAAAVPQRLSIMASNAGARRLYERMSFAAEASDGIFILMRWPA